MNPATYEALPPDVKEFVDANGVHLDPSIPTGQVDVTSQGHTTRMPVNTFVRVRRKARKAEPRNRAERRQKRRRVSAPKFDRATLPRSGRRRRGAKIVHVVL